MLFSCNNLVHPIHLKSQVCFSDIFKWQWTPYNRLFSNSHSKRMPSHFFYRDSFANIPIVNRLLQTHQIEHLNSDWIVWIGDFLQCNTHYLKLIFHHFFHKSQASSSKCELNHILIFPTKMWTEKNGLFVRIHGFLED